ncbi:DUF4124 domain-containing protein [uncultured Massilia sp.]|uniref:DUF4124 domain-containing protein n=1 Tax=uncultured Massilia sp. TaxID=169973 RepID=UPI0025DF8075|nr:DUF4124 domain-containing protein [uncultured Massilia sp.]
MTSSSFPCSAGLAALLAALAVHPGARADAVVYKCVDKQGRVEFTDIHRAGCKPLDLPGYIPAPASAPRPAAAPATTATTAATRPEGAPKPPPNAGPAGFPRVDSAAQRARDDDRRDILNEELRAEEKKLADLKLEYKNGEPDRLGNERNYAKYQERVARLRDDIGRAEKNVEALRREIANIR